jgi:hypothetical protein
MYARTEVDLIKGPVDAEAIARLRRVTEASPHAFVFAQWPGRNTTPIVWRIARTLGVARALGTSPGPAPPESGEPAWAAAAGLEVTHLYALPNGRRYALLQRAG